MGDSQRNRLLASYLGCMYSRQTAHPHTLSPYDVANIIHPFHLSCGSPLIPSGSFWMYFSSSPCQLHCPSISSLLHLMDIVRRKWIHSGASHFIVSSIVLLNSLSLSLSLFLFCQIVPLSKPFLKHSPVGRAQSFPPI